MAEKETKSDLGTLPQLRLSEDDSPEEETAIRKVASKRTSIKSKKENPKKKVATKKPVFKKPPAHKKKVTKKKAAPPRLLKSERGIAIDFASKLHNKFGTMVKATILFGSQAKKQATAVSDIDIIIIIDDAAIEWDLELIAWYREELAKLIASSRYAKDLHINTVKLTTWWHDLMHGDPVIINILRYGEALIDSGGFFNPLKALLAQGKIHSTPEAVYIALQRAPSHLARSKFAVIGAIEGVYWSMVESAQAALITLGKLPPSPEHVTSMLKEYFVDSKMLRMEYVTWYRDIYTLHKSITHREMKGVKGVEIDEWQNKAEKFMKAMSSVIDRLLEAKKD